MWLRVSYERSFAQAQNKTEFEISVHYNGIAGCLLLRGFECIEIRSRHSEMSAISQVSTVEGRGSTVEEILTPHKDH